MATLLRVSPDLSPVRRAHHGRPQPTLVRDSLRRHPPVRVRDQRPPARQGFRGYQTTAAARSVALRRSWPRFSDRLTAKIGKSALEPLRPACWTCALPRDRAGGKCKTLERSCGRPPFVDRQGRPHGVTAPQHLLNVPKGKTEPHRQRLCARYRAGILGRHNRHN